jgi:predicted membrane protein
VDNERFFVSIFLFFFFGLIVFNAFNHFFLCVCVVYIYIYIHIHLVNVDYENYYPKDKKEIPKANEQKSESKGTFLLVLVLCVIC